MRICRTPGCGVKITACFGSVNAGKFLKFLKNKNRIFPSELCCRCATKKWAKEDGYIKW